MPPTPRPPFSLSAGYALPLLEQFRRSGVPADRILADRGLTEESLAHPSARVPLDTVAHLLADVRAHIGGADLGLLIGNSLRVTSFGSVGFAALSAPTLGHALHVATRFGAAAGTPVRVWLNLEGETAALILEEQTDLGAARNTLLVALAIGLWRIGCQLAARELPAVADFAFADTRPALHSVLPLETRFRQPRNQLVFDRSALALPIATAHPAAHALALAQCARALSETSPHDGFVGRVRALIPDDDGKVRSQNEVSTALGLSARSLKRRLAVQGVKFSELTRQHQREIAETLLRSSDLTIEQIADRLGFSTVSNFVRAFRRWAGHTPASFRRAVRTTASK